MNLNQLRAFRTVAAHGSFTGAAKHLGQTQPALTAQVRGLEKTYRVTLFERRPRGVELTATGRALLAVADELFDVEVKAEILLSGTPGALSGPLRIAADNPIPLMPLLATYHDAHPAVRIEATFGNARDVLERLREYRADVALVSGAASDPTFTTKTLDTTPLMVVVPVTHAWSKRKTIALSSLDRRALIRRESGSLTQAALDRSCADANVVPTYPIEMSTREALREAIAQGLGIGVIARGEIGTDERLHAIRIRGIRGPGPLLDVSLACLTARRDVPVIRALFESSARARPRPAPA